MTDKQQSSTVTWQGVKLALAIIIPLLAIAVTWGALNARVEQLYERQTILEAHLERYDSTLLTIEIRLAEIQRDILYIRERLTEPS